MGAVPLMVFSVNSIALHAPKISQIDQSIPIVGETDEISNRQNSLLKSKAQIPNGLRRRSRAQKQFALEIQRVTLIQNNRVGVTGIGGIRWNPAILSLFIVG
jgi:hypothetical protein